jgi:hypothetical protein
VSAFQRVCISEILLADTGSASFEEIRYGVQRHPELRRVSDDHMEECLSTLLTRGQLWIEGSDRYLWTGDATSNS